MRLVDAWVVMFLMKVLWAMSKSYTQNELKEIATQAAGKIGTAKDDQEYFSVPFQHLVIDNFLPESMAQLCLDSFPDLKDASWEHSNDEDIEVKARSTWKSEFDVPDGIVDAVRVLNSAPLLQALGTRLGIPKVMPDPYFSGGGLNATVRGGLLDVHVDGNYHDASGMNRRINALLYLNPGWQPEWGGELGLYDDKGETCLKKIAPLFNRLVVFDTHDCSYHGLPNPIAFPEDAPRRSIILYYYTVASRPAELVTVNEPHSALWKRRGFMDKRGNKTRKFS